MGDWLRCLLSIALASLIFSGCDEDSGTPFIIQQAPAVSSLEFATQPANGTAGVAFSVTVRVQDAAGNVQSAAIGTVSIALAANPSAARLIGTATAPLVNGVATFTNLSLSAAGTGYTLVAATSAVLSGVSQPFDMAAGTSPPPGPAAQVAFLNGPTDIAAGSPISPAIQVEVQDAAGQRVATATDPVTLSFLGGGTLQGVVTVNAVNGVATFSNVTVDLVGSGTLDASAPTLISATSVPFAVTPGPAAAFRVAAAANPISAGAPADLTVTALDDFGNTVTTYVGSITFLSTDPRATLPPTFTFTLADAGTHTFTAGLTLRSANGQLVVASDLLNPVVSGSEVLVVLPGPAASVSVSGFPSQPPAGVPGDMTVTALDAQGNVATGYAGTVVFSSTDTNATLPANYTFVSADSGVHTFPASLTLVTAGSHTVSVADLATPTVSGFQPVAVQSAPATSLDVTNLPSPAAIGFAFAVTVTARDPYGNVASGYTGTVTFGSTDPGVSLPADAPFAPADQGVKTLSASVTFATTGSQTVTATDTLAGTITGSQSVFVDPTPGSVRGLRFEVPPSNAIAGVSNTPTVEVSIVDAAGIIDTSATNAISISLAANPGGGTLSGTLTVSAVAGVAIFPDLSVEKIGAGYVLLASAGGLAAETSLGFNVTPAAADSLDVSPSATTVSAGDPAFDVTVTARDTFGNLATGYTGTVTFTSTDPLAVLPADYTFLAADQGVHTLPASVQLFTSGSQDVIAADGGTTGLASVVVDPLTAVALKLSGPSNPFGAGEFETLIVSAVDVYGNVDTSYGGSVTLASTDVAGSNPTGATLFNGQANAYVQFTTLGTQSITATDVAAVLPPDTLTTTVDIGPIRYFDFVTPASVDAGTPFDVTVTAYDSAGNLITGYTGTVTLTSSDPQAILPAPYTFVPADNGAHTFSGVELRTSGSWKRVAATDAATSRGNSSGSFPVLPGPAMTLEVTGLPDPFKAGLVRWTTVTALDAYGNRASGYTGSVTMSSTDPAVVFSRSSPFSLWSGYAYLDTELRTAGNQTVTATDVSTPSITGGQTVTVVLGGHERYEFSSIPNPLAAGAVFDLTVTATDLLGNPVTGYTGTITFTSPDTQAVLPADYTFVAGDNGSHTFTGLELRTAGSWSGGTISVTDTATNVSSTTPRVTIAPGTAVRLVAESLPDPFPVTNWGRTVYVRAVDVYGNTDTTYTGSVLVTSTDPAAVFPSAQPYVLWSGYTSLQIRLYTLGSQTVTVTDFVNAAMTDSVTVNVVAGPFHGYAVTGIPDPVTAGASSTLTVTAADAGGNPVGNYLGSVTFTSTDPLAVLPGDYTFVATDNGSASFPGTSLRTAGSQTVTVSDVSWWSPRGDLTVDVTAAPATALFPIPTFYLALSGEGFGVTVEARDDYGNVDTGYTGSVSFSSTDGDPGVVLPSNYTFVAGDSGAHAFTGVTLQTTGTQVLTVTDSSLSGPVSLWVPADSEVEPNSTWGSASPLSASGIGIGRIPTSDSDYWSFSATAGDVITAELLAHRFDESGWNQSTPKVTLQLYDTDGTTLLASGEHAIQWSSFMDPDIQCFRIPASGTYYAHVSTQAGNPGGFYRLQIKPVILTGTQSTEVEVAGAGTNDTAASAEVVTGGLILGWLDATSTVDFYRFPLTGATAVEIEGLGTRSGTSINLSIELYDTDGITLLFSGGDNIAYSDPALSCLLIGAGTYYVAVRRVSGSDAPYCLRLTTKPVTGAEIEPNDAGFDATPIAYGAAIRATTSTGDRDMFSFSGSAGDMVHLALFETVSWWAPNVAGATAGDVTITLRDPDGTTLVLDGAPNFPVPVLAAVLTKTGTHFVRVEHAGTAGTYGFVLERYRTSGLEVEPNDARASANDLDALGGRAYGVCNDSGDEDVFSFTATAGEHVVLAIYADNSAGAGWTSALDYFRLTYGTWGNPDMLVTDASGRVLNQANYSPANWRLAAGCANPRSVRQAAIVAPGAGTYYLTVKDDYTWARGPNYFYVVERR